jgi:hypothetical protein
MLSRRSVCGGLRKVNQSAIHRGVSNVCQEMVGPRGYHPLLKQPGDRGRCVENGANDVGTSGHRDRALCGRHHMDPPRNKGHSRYGDERPRQVGGHRVSSGRGWLGVLCLGSSTPPKGHDRVKLKGRESHSHNSAVVISRERKTGFEPATLTLAR